MEGAMVARARKAEATVKAEAKTDAMAMAGRWRWWLQSCKQRARQMQGWYKVQDTKIKQKNT
jgi:hypothetical protein